MPAFIHFEYDLMGFGWSFWDFIWFNLGIRGYKILIENGGFKMLFENWGFKMLFENEMSQHVYWEENLLKMQKQQFISIKIDFQWIPIKTSQSIKITYYDKNQTIQSLRTRSLISFSFILLAKISKNILLVKTKLLLISQETLFWSENKAKKETSFFLRIFYKNSSKERKKEFHS